MTVCRESTLCSEPKSAVNRKQCCSFYHNYFSLLLTTVFGYTALWHEPKTYISSLVYKDNLGVSQNRSTEHSVSSCSLGQYGHLNRCDPLGNLLMECFESTCPHGSIIGTLVPSVVSSLDTGHVKME